MRASQIVADFREGILAQHMWSQSTLLLYGAHGDWRFSSPGETMVPSHKKCHVVRKLQTFIQVYRFHPPWLPVWHADILTGDGWMGKHVLEDVGGVQMRRLEFPGPYYLIRSQSWPGTMLCSVVVSVVSSLLHFFRFWMILVFRVLLVAVAFMPSPDSRYSFALWREV